VTVLVASCIGGLFVHKVDNTFALVRASKRLYAQMDTAGVSHFFNWK